MHRRLEIAEGQRFRRVGVAAGVWEVIGLMRDGAGTLHCRLRRSDDPNTVKMLAATVLADPREFLPLPGKPVVPGDG